MKSERAPEYLATPAQDIQPDTVSANPSDYISVPGNADTMHADAKHYYKTGQVTPVVVPEETVLTRFFARSARHRW